MEKILLTINQFKNLVGAGKESIKDLYNYNGLKISKNQIEAYTTEKVTKSFLESNFYNKECWIIFDKTIISWNGYSICSNDIRTYLQADKYLTVAESKKRLAESNRNNQIKYIIECNIKYNNYWYHNVKHAQVPQDERVNIEQIKYYYSYSGEKKFLSNELQNGKRIYIYDDATIDNINNSIDKSGYQRRYYQEKYKRILENKKQAIKDFVKDFITLNTNTYFNINNELCYRSFSTFEYFDLMMHKLDIKYKCLSSGLSYEANILNYRFSWTEGDFTISFKEQQKKTIFKYKKNSVDYTLNINIYKDDNITLNNDIIEAIKNMIHNNKLFIFENDYGIKACDTVLYNTCYELLNVKIEPTFSETETGQEKICACEFYFDLVKGNTYNKYNDKEHNKLKALFSAIV